ncbi:MAG: M15 family metallopeptidase [Pseudomonadota bacterium]
MNKGINLLGLILLTSIAQAAPPDNFVSIREVDPTIVLEIRYAGAHNFLGRPVNGYGAPACWLTKKAAAALQSVQAELQKFGLSLKVYDCYRPQRAVADFVAWAKDLNDTKMKKEFYPRVEKINLFRDGYIAEKSGHTRGSAVDLTIVPIPPPRQREFREKEKLIDCAVPRNKRFPDNTLDMGTGYDCFDPLAHPANQTVGIEQRKNRLLLKSIMEKNGFVGIAEEWWHFKLKEEPYPDTYFDFKVEEGR